MNKGFTLIEIVVVIAIIGVLSSIIMFSVTQYINSGKDSNISGNLTILVPAGEAWYNVENAENQDGYTGFCASGPSKNAFSQMPTNIAGSCYSPSNLSGVCCVAGQDSWAACAREFTDKNKAYCVDSRGIKRFICAENCIPTIAQCVEDSCS